MPKISKYTTVAAPADTDAYVVVQGGVTKKITYASIKSGIIGDVDALIYKGVIACAGSPNYPAADSGHVYKISTAGNIGGAAGPVVQVGDVAICSVDASAVGTHAAVGANWNILQTNVDIESATAVSDFLVGGSSPFGWVRKTLAQVKTILGIGGTVPEPTAENDVIMAAGSPLDWAKKTLVELKMIMGLGTAAFTAATDYIARAGGTMLGALSLGSSYLSTTKIVGTAGVTANLLCKIDATGNVVTAALSDVGILGVTVSTKASTEPVEVATRGIVMVVADNTTVLGNLAIVGTGTAGRCRDSGQANSTAISITTQVVGKFLSVATVGNVATLQLYGPGHYGNSLSTPPAIGLITPAAAAFTTLKVTTNAGQGKILVSDADGDLSYLTLNNGINRIGIPGECGFGVGICPEANLPPGMTPMDGCYQLGHVNYGNYIFFDGSIMVYVPKFYYRMHTWAVNQITAISKANPCEVTQIAHGYVNGDKVFLCNVGGMTQVEKLVFTVTRVDADKYTLGVDSSAYTTFTSLGDSCKGFGADFEFNRTLVTHGKNSISIRGTETFANEAAANTGAYAMHRAFWDGNVEQPGFFFDKYKCSKNPLGSGFVASSLPNGKPLSTASTHNPMADLTGGANYYYSTIDLAHRRDGVNGNVNNNSIFHCRSQFQGGALAMLATAHGQYSQNDTWCAWYSATTNFPKGCNNNALKDTDDSLVTYASDGYSNCGRTGSAIVFAKTMHNGQACGIADLNGLMYEPSIGLTCIATTVAITDMSRAAACEITWASHDLETGGFVQILAITQADWSGAKDKIWSIIKTGDNTFTIAFNSSAFGTAYDAATDPGTITKGTFYAAKKTVAMKTFTNGNTGATDHWGATGVAAMMDAFAPPFKSGFAFAMRYGSGVNQVLSEALSGAGWNLTGLGLPVNGAGVDATGTNLFGKDYFYQYFVNELFLLACYYWLYYSDAGVWFAGLSYARGYSTNTVGLRVACYPV